LGQLVGKWQSNQFPSISGPVAKPVGVTAAGSATDQLVKYLLRKEGLDPQAIPVVTAGISTMLAALEQDHVWAGVTVDPLASKFERDGIATMLYETRTEKGTVDIFGGHGRREVSTRPKISSGKIRAPFKRSSMRVCALSDI